MNKYNENQDITKKIYELSFKEFSHDEIFDILRSEEEYIKPLAILNLNEIKTEQELRLLISHLTCHDGRIREAVSSKLLQLSPCHIQNEDILIDALCDVNPNVCRDITFFLKDYKNPPTNKIIERIFLILKDIKENYTKTPSKFRENKEKSKKDHVLNKKVFHLYWLLEALNYTLEDENNEDVIEILKICSEFFNYTIREKVAQILNKMKNPPNELLQKLKNDENFYVKNQICDRIEK